MNDASWTIAPVLGPPRRNRSRILVAIFLVFAATLVGALILWWVPTLRYGTFVPADSPDFGFDVSQDGQRIVFSYMGRGSRDLYLLNRATGKITTLRATGEREVEPCFSPDEKHIIFSSARGLQYPHHLWLMEVDGSNARQLTFGDRASDRDPEVMPDGAIRCTRWKLLEFAVKAASWHGPEPYSLGGILNPAQSAGRQTATVDYVFASRDKPIAEGESIKMSLTLFDSQERKQKTLELPGQLSSDLPEQVRVAERGKAAYLLESITMSGTFGPGPVTAEIWRLDLTTREAKVVVNETTFKRPLETGSAK